MQAWLGSNKALPNVQAKGQICPVGQFAKPWFSEDNHDETSSQEKISKRMGGFKLCVEKVKKNRIEKERLSLKIISHALQSISHKVEEAEVWLPRSKDWGDGAKWDGKYWTLSCENQSEKEKSKSMGASTGEEKRFNNIF